MTAYEMRISDWSSDVCSSDLVATDRQGDPQGRDDRQRFGVRRISARRREGGGRPRRRVRPLARDADQLRDLGRAAARSMRDRKSVVWGKGVSVRVDLGERRVIKKKIKIQVKYLNIHKQ